MWVGLVVVGGGTRGRGCLCEVGMILRTGCILPSGRILNGGSFLEQLCASAGRGLGGWDTPKGGDGVFARRGRRWSVKAKAVFM